MTDSNVQVWTVTNAAPTETNAAVKSAEFLRLRFANVRAHTPALAQPLSPEDMVIQSMPDVSPTKWHLAHTSWFFEAFILKPLVVGYAEFDPNFHYLFNSYYEAEGPRHPRPERGLISRPDIGAVLAYRQHVDTAMTDVLADLVHHPHGDRIAELTALGCQHEEQHQELILTDIKHVLSRNPAWPAYREGPAPTVGTAPALQWTTFEGGLDMIGHSGTEFAFDCEQPAHQVYVHPFALTNRLVTNGDYLEFIEDGGYDRADLWLSDGWAHISEHRWRHPLYWRDRKGEWREFTLHGDAPLSAGLPVCHLSYYEAEAFARWAGYRLPREEELEVASRPGWPSRDDGDFHQPLHPDRADRLCYSVWQWTASPYTAYPGFRAAPGAVGEYNGKFMCNQFVLKGGSCFTPSGHARPTYRNFFPADARWQMTGLRLARDL